VQFTLKNDFTVQKSFKSKVAWVPTFANCGMLMVEWASGHIEMKVA
jgi:hypothetical protein